MTVERISCTNFFITHSSRAIQILEISKKVSSAVYSQSRTIAMSYQKRAMHHAKVQEFYPFQMPEEMDKDCCAKIAVKKQMDALAQHNVDQDMASLFQDVAIAHQVEERIIVALHGHWIKLFLTQTQAAVIQFYVPPPSPPISMGKDVEILQAVIGISCKYKHSKSNANAANGGYKTL